MSLFSRFGLLFFVVLSLAPTAITLTGGDGEVEYANPEWLDGTSWVEPTDQPVICHYSGVEGLHTAALLADTQYVKKIIAEEIANPNERDCSALTPLHYVVKLGMSDGVRMLLQNPRTDPNIAGRDKRTPLHYAVEMGSDEMVRDLLKYGYDRIIFGLRDINGCTPLEIALNKECESIVKMLRNAGAQ